MTIITKPVSNCENTRLKKDESFNFKEKLLKFESRHFKRDATIPRPFLRVDDSIGLFFIASPWGDEKASHLAFEEIVRNLKAMREDREATTPFEKLEVLNPLENDLRIATLFANDKIFRTLNDQEYSSSLELTILMRHQRQIVWLTSGGHQIQYLHRGFKSNVCGQMAHQECPLPSHMMGIDRTCWLSCGSFQFQEDSKIIVISDSAVTIPPAAEFGVELNELANFQTSRPVSFWVVAPVF